MATEFPIGDTVGGWRVTGHLLRGGSQELCVAERVDRPDQRAMVSAMWAPRGVELAELRPRLEMHAPGILALEHIGPFDETGDDDVRRIQQGQHIALVERLPPGDGVEWLPHMIDGALGPRTALVLGISVGAILARAAARGALLVGIRPEYIWAEAERLQAVGLTARNWEFFASVRGRCLAPATLFRRHYCAPEVVQERGEREESLVFTLAVMIAEWATGLYPFPDSWAGGNTRTLCEGRHAPLDLPPPIAGLLGRSLRARPEERPSLSEFLTAAAPMSGRAR
jgi:hypothetical protein